MASRIRRSLKKHRNVLRKVSSKARRHLGSKGKKVTPRTSSVKKRSSVSRKASRKVSRKPSRKVSRKASRKVSRKASRKVSRKASRKVSLKKGSKCPSGYLHVKQVKGSKLSSHCVEFSGAEQMKKALKKLSRKGSRKASRKGSKKSRK